MRTTIEKELEATRAAKKKDLEDFAMKQAEMGPRYVITVRSSICSKSACGWKYQRK